MLERSDQTDRNDGDAELLRHAEAAILERTQVPLRVRIASGKMIRLVPPSMASCVNRHMRFRSDERRTSGTGTLPKRFISQPYAGILKWDSAPSPAHIEE